MIKSNKSNINYRFLNALKLNPNLNYELGLIYFSTYNSIFNITNKNNKIEVTISGFKDKKEKIKTFNLALYLGAYKIKDISKVINNEIKYKNEFDLLDVVDKKIFIY
jgi:hypothetical protein